MYQLLNLATGSSDLLVIKKCCICIYHLQTVFVSKGSVLNRFDVFCIHDCHRQNYLCALFAKTITAGKCVTEPWACV